MEKKINIAKLLKDCPKGMELDCTMFENLEFDRIEKDGGSGKYYIICRVKTKIGYNVHTFTEHGCYSSNNYAKCVIYPKGKTTWEGFVPPCKFKDGDILYAIDEGNEFIFILKHIFEHGRVYCYLSLKGDDLRIQEVWLTDYNPTHRLATEEEKQKLFQTIKENGYKWNAETKTLEKLVEPKFKVGDKVRYKNNHDIVFTITNIDEDSYICGAKATFCSINDQDQYELVPTKFDINTLVPFESKVLVRNSDSGFWKPAFWGIYEAEKSNEHKYRNHLTTEGFVRHCIPYNDETKHLIGKTIDCPEYYKTW